MQSCSHFKSMAFQPDGKTLSVATDDEIGFWDLALRNSLAKPSATGSFAHFAAFSRDGKLLATAVIDGSIELWDLAARQRIGERLQGRHSSPLYLVFSPDGNRLAVAGEDGTIQVWDLPTRQPIGGDLPGHRAAILGLAFSPDGKLLASESQDGALRLWNLDPDSWPAQDCRVANRNLSMAEGLQFIGTAIPYRKTCPQFPPGLGAPPTSQ